MQEKSEETKKDRLISFDDVLFARVRKSASGDKRHFKHQAAILIEEALDARDRHAAMADES